MDKLHYKTLAAAVAKYGGIEGEDDIKAAIAADEKKFTPEQIEEIYQAIVNPETGGEVRHIVLLPFRDIGDFLKKWGPGDDVSHFDPKRLERLVSLGLVEARKVL